MTQQAPTFRVPKSTMLVDRYLELSDEIATLHGQRHRLEMEILARMEADGATEFVTERAVAKVESDWSYDPSRLHRLRELLAPEVLEEGYTPAHEETVQVPERWDGRKMRYWTKYGADVAAILDAARVLKSRRLVVKAKAVVEVKP